MISDYNTDGKKADKDTEAYRYAVDSARHGYSTYSQYEAIAAALLAMARCKHENMRRGDDYFEPVEAIGMYARHQRFWCHDCGFDSAFAWKYHQPWLLDKHLIGLLVSRGKNQLEQMQEFKALVKADQDKFDMQRLQEDKTETTTNT